MSNFDSMDVSFLESQGEYGHHPNPSAFRAVQAAMARLMRENAELRDENQRLREEMERTGNSEREKP